MANPSKGHKSIPWDQDPEILRRLATVEDLVLAGYRNTEIGHALNVTEGTIRRDRERIAELWRRQVTGDIAAMRERSIANLRRIQRLADNEFRNKRNQTANLRIQLDAEREIIKVQGTIAPVEVPISFTDKTDPHALSTHDITERAAALEGLAQQLLAEEASADGIDL